MEVVSVKRGMVQSKLGPFTGNAEGRPKKVRKGGGDTHRKKGALTCTAQF